MPDHDQRFKILVREFCPEVVGLFYPSWAARFDFTNPEWLEKEIFLNPPQGQRLILDLVVKLPTREVIPGQRPGEPDSHEVLVLIEIESRDYLSVVRSHLHDFYDYLRQQHRLPVWPLGVYLRVGLQGLGFDSHTDKVWEDEVQRFQFRYVGLPALDGAKYLAGDNWLGVALSALMRIPEDRKGWHKAEALRRLVSCPENEFRRYLLCECVDAYLPLEGPQLAEFEHLLVTEPYKEIDMQGTTWTERGQEKGERRVVLMQLEKRFGPLDAKVKERFDALPAERVAELGLALLDAQSLQELGLRD